MHCLYTGKWAQKPLWQQEQLREDLSSWAAPHVQGHGCSTVQVQYPPSPQSLTWVTGTVSDCRASIPGFQPYSHYGSYLTSFLKILFGLCQPVWLFARLATQSSWIPQTDLRHALCLPASHNLAHCSFHPELFSSAFSTSQNSSHLLRPSVSSTFPINIIANT